MVRNCAQGGPHDEGRGHERQGAPDRPDPGLKLHRPVGRRTRGGREELDVETGENQMHAYGRHNGLDPGLAKRAVASFRKEWDKRKAAVTQ